MNYSKKQKSGNESKIPHESYKCLKLTFIDSNFNK